MDSHFWERTFSTGEIENMTKEEFVTEKEEMLKRHENEIYNLWIKYLHLNKKFNIDIPPKNYNIFIDFDGCSCFNSHYFN